MSFHLRAAVGNILARWRRGVKIGYNSHMTKRLRSELDLLGSPLPGAVWLPDYAVRIGKRGAQEVLEWKIAQLPAPPHALADSPFVSLPRPVSDAMMKRVEQRRRERSRGRNSNKKLSAEELMAMLTEDPEELMAMFSQDPGMRIQTLRRLLPGEPPFYGGAGVLDDFILLAQRPSAIPAFAAYWGPLGICEHLKPWTHSLWRSLAASAQPTCCPLGATASQGRQGWEPVAKWLDYSREAGDIVHEAIKLKSARERPQLSLQRLFGRVSEWIEMAAVPIAAYPDVYTEKSWPCGFSTTFAVSGVFQIVALQLLGVVAGGRALAQCTHCGVPFVITGHREGVRRFCRTCVTNKVPIRYAVRDYRARGSRPSKR